MSKCCVLLSRSLMLHFGFSPLQAIQPCKQMWDKKENGIDWFKRGKWRTKSPKKRARINSRSDGRSGKGWRDRDKWRTMDKQTGGKSQMCSQWPLAVSGIINKRERQTVTETQGGNRRTKPVFPFTFFPVRSTFVEALTKVVFQACRFTRWPFW